MPHAIPFEIISATFAVSPTKMLPAVVRQGLEEDRFMKPPGWLLELFQAIDAKDSVAFAAHLVEDVSLVFGNAAPLHGKAAAQAAVAGFFQSIAALRHEILET